MTTNAIANEKEIWRERWNALLGLLVLLALSDCNKSGSLLVIMLEFDVGPSVGKSPMPTNSVVAPVLLIVVVASRLLATVEFVPEDSVSTLEVVVHWPIRETLTP